MVSLSGHKIQFWSKVVRHLPDGVVRDLIAHELAHVTQWARGQDLNTDDCFMVEFEADELIEEWGFSSESIDDWYRQRYGIRDVDIKAMKPRQARDFWKRVERTGRL